MSREEREGDSGGLGAFWDGVDGSKDNGTYIFIY